MAQRMATIRPSTNEDLFFVITVGVRVIGSYMDIVRMYGRFGALLSIGNDRDRCPEKYRDPSKWTTVLTFVTIYSPRCRFWDGHHVDGSMSGALHALFRSPCGHPSIKIVERKLKKFSARLGGDLRRSFPQKLKKYWGICVVLQRFFGGQFVVEVLGTTQNEKCAVSKSKRRFWRGLLDSWVNRMIRVRLIADCIRNTHK